METSRKRALALQILFLAGFLLFASLWKSYADFPDVPEDHPNYDAINYLQENGTVEGNPGGTYDPNDEIQRSAFTKIIVESLYEDSEIDSCNTSSFSDVTVGVWYAQYVCMAHKHNLISGYPNGTFQAGNNINFAEAAKIISLAYGGNESTSEVWYQDYVDDLASKKAIPMGIEAFDKQITRGDMAEVIYRVDANITTKPSQTYASLNGETDMECHDDHCHEIPVICIDEGCNEVTITTDGTYRYIESNGIPNHETGDFPNSGNPNTISKQSHSYRVTLNPSYLANSIPVPVPGVALNGLPFEPGTAERNGDYNIEAFQDEFNLGLDENNAHVQPTGSYHYHGIPTGLVDSLKGNEDLVQVGWAADGFPMVVSQSNAYASSYELKSGTRPDIGGTYNGTYTQDFEYIENSGDLDDCNGITIDGEYMYVLTNEFPYISRCLHGEPDDSFSRGGGGNNEPSQEGPGENQGPSQGGPPQGAIDACSGESIGASCSFTGGMGTVSGTCRDTPDGMACAP